MVGPSPLVDVHPQHCTMTRLSPSSTFVAAPPAVTPSEAARRESDRPLSLRELLQRLNAARKSADETNTALLVWLIRGSALGKAERHAASLPARLLSGNVSWLPIQQDRFAVVVRDLEPDDLLPVGELIRGAMPAGATAAAFAYPTDWYLLDNDPPSKFKRDATLGAAYLARCLNDAQFRQAGQELSDKPYLCLEPAFFRPTPAWKRVMDILVAAAAMMILAPVLLSIAALIKLRSPGPLFFWHARHGGCGLKFRMCKFRTMEVDFDATQHSHHLRSLLAAGKPLKKMDTQTALIPNAKWIRAMGLDELPQLWNVLRGEMSLVGPRPDVIAMDHYSKSQRRRFDVLPGLTGLWQISGKNRTTFDQMLDYDIQYIENRSLWNDTKIVLKTIPAVIRVAVD